MSDPKVYINVDKVSAFGTAFTRLADAVDASADEARAAKAGVDIWTGQSADRHRDSVERFSSAAVNGSFYLRQVGSELSKLAATIPGHAAKIAACAAEEDAAVSAQKRLRGAYHGRTAAATPEANEAEAAAAADRVARAKRATLTARQALADAITTTSSAISTAGGNLAGEERKLPVTANATAGTTTWSAVFTDYDTEYGFNGSDISGLRNNVRKGTTTGQWLTNPTIEGFSVNTGSIAASSTDRYTNGMPAASSPHSPYTSTSSGLAATLTVAAAAEALSPSSPLSPYSTVNSGLAAAVTVSAAATPVVSASGTSGSGEVPGGGGSRNVQSGGTPPSGSPQRGSSLSTANTEPPVVAEVSDLPAPAPGDTAAPAQTEVIPPAGVVPPADTPAAPTPEPTTEGTTVSDPATADPADTTGTTDQQPSADGPVAEPSAPGSDTTATPKQDTPVDTSPVAGTTSTAAPVANTPTLYTVQTGDNMWSISERTLADAWGRQPSPVETTSYLAAVIDANRATLPDPSNPALIHAGGTLTIPPVPQAV